MILLNEKRLNTAKTRSRNLTVKRPKLILVKKPPVPVASANAAIWAGEMMLTYLPIMIKESIQKLIKSGFVMPYIKARNALEFVLGISLVCLSFLRKLIMPKTKKSGMTPI